MPVLPKCNLSAGCRFFNLVVTDAPSVSKNGNRYYTCACDCGSAPFLVRSDTLRNMRIRSCGCLYHRDTGDRKRGIRAAPLYYKWSAMRDRCTNPNHQHYYRYGGRGITVCDEWNAYIVFRKWALDNGFSKELQIDRIDNNGNYCPGNCRFVTRAENMSNRENSRIYTAFGETKTLSEWAKDPRCKVSYKTLSKRLKIVSAECSAETIIARGRICK